MVAEAERRDKNSGRSQKRGTRQSTRDGIVVLQVHMNEVPSFLIPDDEPILRMVGVIFSVSFALYLVVIMLRRLWHRRQLYIEALVLAIVRREISRSFEIMLVRLGEHTADGAQETVCVRAAAAAAPPVTGEMSNASFFNPLRPPPSPRNNAIAVSSSSTKDHDLHTQLLEMAAPRPSVTSTIQIGSFAHKPTPTWLTVLKEDVRNFRRLQNIGLLTDAELEDIAATSVEDLRRRCWFVHADMARRLVRHVTRNQYQAYYQQLINEYVEFAIILQRMAVLARSGTPSTHG